MKKRSSMVIGMFVAVLSLFGCTNMSGPGDGGWVTLIDGARGLENWNRVGHGNWRAEGGAIVADGSVGGKENGYLVTRSAYRDFQIRAEFWASHDANSGIFIRASDPNKIGANNSYEVNIFDQRKDPTYGTAAIVDFAKVVPMPKAGGKWNTFDITAQGSHLVVIFNGQKTVDIRDSKYAGGPFALQYGAGVIKFRKVQIRELGGASAY